MEEKVQAKQVGPKHNLLGKGSSEAGWAKIQPKIYNDLGERTYIYFMVVDLGKVEPKHNLLGKGWTKNYKTYVI